jgi:hypothetical protein
MEPGAADRVVGARISWRSSSPGRCFISTHSRRVRLTIDGVLAARVYPGRTVRIEAAPGQNVVLARHTGVRRIRLKWTCAG